MLMMKDLYDLYYAHGIVQNDVVDDAKPMKVMLKLSMWFVDAVVEAASAEYGAEVDVAYADEAVAQVVDIAVEVVGELAVVGDAEAAAEPDVETGARMGPGNGGHGNC